MRLLKPGPALTFWSAAVLAFLIFGYAAGARPGEWVTIVWAFAATAAVDVLWLAFLERMTG